MMGRFGAASSLGQIAWALRRQWRQLPVERRGRLQALLRQSAGRPSNLSPTERQELRALVAELNLGQVVREGALGASRRGGRRGFR